MLFFTGVSALLVSVAGSPATLCLSQTDGLSEDACSRAMDVCLRITSKQEDPMIQVDVTARVDSGSVLGILLPEEVVQQLKIAHTHDIDVTGAGGSRVNASVFDKVQVEIRLTDPAAGVSATKVCIVLLTTLLSPPSN